MKRNPRKTRWTKAFRRTHGKELSLVCVVLHCTPVHYRSCQAQFSHLSSLLIAHLFSASFPAPQDTTFEFEKRRNVPVKYDRELVSTTLTAMKRVQEIKERREKRFYAKRMEHKPEQEAREGL